MASALWRDHPARAELLDLYARTDSLLAPFSCAATTHCCQFAITGREPYPTAVELAEVRYAARGLGKNLFASATKRRSVALAADPNRVCPLLSSTGRCRIYASRPFGCRTFFCDRRTGPGRPPRDDLQELGRCIAALSARFDPNDPHPRPLCKALERAFVRGSQGGRR